MNYRVYQNLGKGDNYDMTGHRKETVQQVQIFTEDIYAGIVNGGTGK